MPTLTWVGKDKVVNHHHDVPFRVLNKQYTFEADPGTRTNSTDNRIIHGDNLEALKSLLPEFEGKVKCIYIDPPYNTGNEGWCYNDNVNDPKMQKWLGEVVGKEGEDLSRHDKWLCMMYPRLKLLHRLLAKDGIFLCSIDENEYHRLKLVLDEICGLNAYVGSICWRTRNTDNRVKTRLSVDHEYVLVYSLGAPLVGRLIDRSDFKNPDNDPRGPYVTDPLTGKATAEDRPNLHYVIENPLTLDKFLPDPARGWITDFKGYRELLLSDRIWWPVNAQNGNPRKKRFLSETSDRMPLSSFWADTKGQTGADELDNMLGKRLFAFPKAVDFISRLLDVVCSSDALILDSFSGSGTTAHAVLKLNAQDGGHRRFILVERMDYAETITAERVRRVMNGYGSESKAVDGLGGGFDYYTIGEPLFTADDLLNESVGVDAIRGYVAYTEGIRPEDQVSQDNPVSPYLLGRNADTAWFFYYEPDRPTALNMEFLGGIQIGDKPGTTIIYADRCLLSSDFMTKNGLIFKKIPRDISRF
ncbi:type III restriction endonuclease subunit M [Acidithiobacillus ferrivorans]|uniref:site-specific DNA-methyltransferase (adenine-specific) n=1 Tax=Acidithiobacillus ferrivorans TaxID=160808 RepID=A0A1B9C005_9PROT|nr:site-specific DNA-methyltransferase [Acidithiobacillus ferrivorans]OCB03271.1 type III restriction endonuclease subunit M [Acidithiobacillus ferrivorans]